MTSLDFEPDTLDDTFEPTFDANLPSPPLRSAEVHKGFIGTEPFAAREKKKRSLIDSIVSTAFFRCWHILILFTLWATIVTVVNINGKKKFQIPSTLLTVVGTVLGFITSTRSSTSFDRYNQGKMFWSKLIHNSRVFARVVWFNVPEMAGEDGKSSEESRARDLIEKRTVLNLVLAHAVALKHYLRHEDGIYYKDLYYLVKFLPAYVEHHSIPSPSAQDGDRVFNEITRDLDPFTNRRDAAVEEGAWHNDTALPYNPYSASLPRSPRPPRSPLPPRSPAFPRSGAPKVSRRHRFMDRIGFHRHRHAPAAKVAILSRPDEAFLLPAKKPPKYHLLDLFPFSLMVKFLSQKYKDRQSRRARMKELLRRKRVNHNLPLEISYYIGSYITMVQKRKVTDNLSINVMNQSLNQMVEAATNLERILTTPLPFIYSIHMWLIALIYCFLLPLQIIKDLKWLTIPATALMTFIYFGFLVAGEELEDPFGYDRNDLDLDHFTNHVMQNELKAITSAPPPDPNRWIFVPENNVLFSRNLDERITPNEWMNIGPEKIQRALRTMQ